MQVSCNEGLAGHVIPESYAVCRETCGEALTGVRAGQPLSRDSLLILSADAVDKAERNTTERDIASTPFGSAWSKTLARAHADLKGRIFSVLHSGRVFTHLGHERVRSRRASTSSAMAVGHSTLPTVLVLISFGSLTLGRDPFSSRYDEAADRRIAGAVWRREYRRSSHVQAGILRLKFRPRSLAGSSCRDLRFPPSFTRCGS